MSHKNDLSACIKWRAGNANGGRLEESPRAGKLSNGTFGRRRQGRAGQGCCFFSGWAADCPAGNGSNRGRRCLIFMPNPVGINWRTRELRVELNLQCVI